LFAGPNSTGLLESEDPVCLGGELDGIVIICDGEVVDPVGSFFFVFVVLEEGAILFLCFGRIEVTKASQY
jgi:hypothetical protein